MTAPKKRPLRAVKASDKPPVRRARSKTITQAADSGTPRELLVALRARIAKSVEDPNTPARDLASLSRRLLEIARDIEAIDAAAEQEATESAETTGDEALDAEAF